MRSAALILAVSLASLALPVQAQERTPAQRQTLADIAYVLGESHALRQVCEGAYDQYWRDRMIGVTDAEAPDEALDRRLKEAFNAGFASRRAEFPECNRSSRIAEVAAARRGQALASSLAAVRYRVDPREAEARRQAQEMEADLALRP
ncbi:MAG: TIGR02301 family protein [Phenylobacterium sp.]|uniref:TIGR02301 family protein n=1 Tax=Phenylobacterium sp. TaxID=1871053 RepID=UPI00271B7DCA|nr:TIGR02301 family protein [Phenylobacterium sp.]MDO8901120.1 TIGR02301 family protein [Phenylobacterium sp.]MDP2214346.1 TIGR02301 family protein [Phenylobacterium sp.]